MALVVNLPKNLQNADPGFRLADEKGIADCISEARGVQTNDGITASTTQTQAGGTQLTRGWNRVATANASDAVTLPQAVAGMTCAIVNTSTQTIQVFPFLGDTICAAVKNAAVTTATATTSEFFCLTAGQWWGGATTNEA